MISLMGESEHTAHRTHFREAGESIPQEMLRTTHCAPFPRFTEGCHPLAR